MPDDIYRMARTMRTLGAGDPFADTQYSRENPVENALQAAANVNKLNQLRMKTDEMYEAQKERASLKNALGDLDMEDTASFGKVAAIAPELATKLFQTVGGLRQEDRFKAVNLAKNINEFVGQALPHLAQNPDAYPVLTAQLKKMGASDEYIAAVVPNPTDFQGRPKAYQDAIFGSLATKQFMAQKTTEIKGQFGLDQEELKYKGIVKRGEDALAVQEKKTESAKATSTGASKQYYNEKDDVWIETRMKADGSTVTTTYPKGVKPKEVILKEMGGGKTDGKGKDKVGFDKFRNAGEKGKSGGFNKDDVTDYNAVIATKDPAKIEEAQKRMKTKYGKLP